MEEAEIKINEDGSVSISQYDKYEFSTNICILNPHQAMMFALEYVSEH